MPKEKNINKLASKKFDNNFKFSDLLKILKSLGFNERIKGDHHIFSKKNVEEIINLQPRKDGSSKPYQVKQVRNILIKYNLI